MLTLQATHVPAPAATRPGAARRWSLPRWPLPALAAWAMAWAVHLTTVSLHGAPWLGAAAATLLGLACSLFARDRLRALVIAGGFPLSLLASGAALAVPGWAWLLPLVLLLLLYPRRAWRDAPLFPTPRHALDGLAGKAVLAPAARVLDAGCGLGDGLQALRRAYPLARIDGVEWSWPLALVSRLRCRFARVQRGDMWARSWRHYDLVYLFQRPESLPRAIAKAQAEMAAGAWLASLEFEAEQWLPRAVLECADGRPLWLYRLPLRAMPAAVSLGTPVRDAAPRRRARRGAACRVSSGSAPGR